MMNMNTIGKFRFVLGIVIVSIIVGFLVSIPFASILNTNDVVSSTVVKEIVSLSISAVSVFLAFFYAYKNKEVHFTSYRCSDFTLGRIWIFNG